MADAGYDVFKAQDGAEVRITPATPGNYFYRAFTKDVQSENFAIKMGIHPGELILKFLQPPGLGGERYAAEIRTAPVVLMQAERHAQADTEARGQGEHARADEGGEYLPGDRLHEPEPQREAEGAPHCRAERKRTATSPRPTETAINPSRIAFTSNSRTR